MRATDIACRACAAQPGEECQRWSDLEGRMTVVPGLIHPERVEDSACEPDANGSSASVSKEQFTEALDRSGLF